MLTIVSGLAEGQVLQRSRSGEASLTLTLRNSGGRGDLFATILQSRKPLKLWKRRRIGIAKQGEFRVKLAGIPEGGPYSLRLECGKSSASVESFYVGDVWILAGQSNMEGAGDMAGAAKPHPLIRVFSMRREWRLAEDPLHLRLESPDACHNEGTQWTPEQGEIARRNAKRGVGPGLFFAKEMLKKTGIPQGLICAAHGGTSMSQWDPKLKKLGGKSLYASMLMSVEATGQPVAGVLWYQGESDVGVSGSGEYAIRMKKFVATVRKDLGQSALPWIMVQISRVAFVNGESPLQWNGLQEAQRLLPDQIPNLEVVAAIDLPLVDFIHVDADGQAVLGKRLARAADRLVHRNKEELPAPRLKNAIARAQGNVSIVEVSFTGVKGNLQSGGTLPGGFTVLGPDSGTKPWIFKTTLAGNSVILHLLQPAPLGSKVAYGSGFMPHCNIQDERGFALPVFGPQPILQGAAWLPFVTRWKVTPVLAMPDGRTLLDLEAGDFDRHETEVRVYGAEGFVNEHPRWQGNPGYAWFGAVVDLPEKMALEVSMGYDGPFRLWIDDQPFFTDVEGINPCFPDEQAKGINLSRGKHKLTVAMDTSKGLAWGFFLRFKRKGVPRTKIGTASYLKPEYLV